MIYTVSKYIYDIKGLNISMYAGLDEQKLAIRKVVKPQEKNICYKYQNIFSRQW